MRIALSLVLILLSAGCLPRPAWLEWEGRVFGAGGVGAPKSQIRARLGAPDYVMTMEQFVAALDDGPGQYSTTEIAGDMRFNTYREYIVYELWRHQHPGVSRPPYDPDWYKQPEFATLELWLYDDSTRFKRLPNPTLFLFGFRGTVCEYFSVIGGEGVWNPGKFRHGQTSAGFPQTAAMTHSSNRLLAAMTGRIPSR